MQALSNVYVLAVRSASLGVTLAAFLAVVPAEAEQTKDTEAARAWLDRTMHAAQSLNYDGTFIYRNGKQMESMRIIHRADPNGERSRLISLSGEAREVLRDQSKVTCILPDSGAVLVGKSRPHGPFSTAVFEANAGFAEYYSLSVMGGDRIAGRDTEVVTVEPKDNYRYGYRVWVDQDTGLLLRSELVDEAGAALEQFIFTSVSIPTQIPDDLLEPGISGEHYTWYNDPEPVQKTAKPTASGWQVGWLPEGFMMTDRREQPAAIDRMPVEHLAYTDGLASISVFIEQLDSNGEPLEGASGMGAMNAFGSMVDGYQVTVVGEVPQRTVRAVAESISRK